MIAFLTALTHVPERFFISFVSRIEQKGIGWSGLSQEDLMYVYCNL